MQANKQMQKQKQNVKQSNRPKKPKTRRNSKKKQQRMSNLTKPIISETRTVPLHSGNTVVGRRLPSKTVTFREELGPITGSIAFATTAYNINPGQAQSFPWLALEAKQWEKYRFTKLKYIYTPQVTAFSANGIGSVVIGFDADASDAPPNDLIHALNVKPRSFNLPCKNIILDVPGSYLNMLTDGYYVRPGNLPGQSDIKTFDCGVINISTVGQASAAVLGIMAVEYTVTFFIPMLEPVIGAPRNNSTSALLTNDQALVTGVQSTLLYATVNTNGINIVNTAGSLLLPAGNYIVNLSFRATNGGANITAFTGQFYKDGTPDPMTLADVSGGATNMTLTGVFFVSSDGSNAISGRATATFGAGATTIDSLIVITSV